MGQSIEDENGSVLLVVLMLVILMTIIGISAISSSVNELRIARYDRVAKRNFYNAESALNNAIAIFDRIYTNSADTNGITLYAESDTSLPLRDQDISNASVEFPSPLTENKIPLAWVEIRTILLKTNKTASALTPLADQTPSMLHITSPPKGFDLNTYRGRRFAITATAIDPKKYNAADPKAGLTNVIIQTGIIHAEETSKVFHMIDL